MKNVLKKKIILKIIVVSKFKSIYVNIFSVKWVVIHKDLKKPYFFRNKAIYQAVSPRDKETPHG